MTLRAVGGRAGLTRGAPYGHFAGKDHLLAALAVRAWDGLAAQVEHIRAESAGDDSKRLEEALLALLHLARRQPHLYALMFTTPADSPDAARAAERLQDQFLAVVAPVTGSEAALRYGALLLSSAHGIAALELGGQLNPSKWDVEGGRLIRMLVSAVRAGLSERDQ